MALKAGRVGVNPSQVDDLGNIIGKQDTLTFDTEPTEASTNPVTSGGVYTALSDKLSYEANSILGAKNLFPLVLSDIKALNTNGTWSDNEYTLNGVTFTINTDDDGNVTSINIDGTAASSTYFYFISGASKSFNGNFIFSGQPNFVTGQVALTCIFANTQVDVYAEDVVKSLSDTLNSAHMFLWYGRTFSNLTIHPMIRFATDTDATFRPYAMTNLELTAAIRALQNNI